MEAIDKHRFDDIRSVFDEEVSATIQSLISNQAFRNAAELFIKPMSWEAFEQTLTTCQSVYDFQRKLVYPMMKQLIGKTTSLFATKGIENAKDGKKHLYVSNHRDIVLDAAFLNIMFFDEEIETTEIAIGDNLLVYPWITELVRLNKSFIVKRGVSVREMLATSKHLSEYIHDTINNRQQSVWIAQREGRAKDSNDRTQTSMLKMLTLHNSANPIEALQSLNIVPLSLSYEFDPCDYLKAKEFQMKRDNPEHKKTKADDVENMITGIMGYKGRVVFSFGKSISSQLASLNENLPRAEVLDKTAETIDREIFSNYVFYPINYIAFDLMEGKSRFEKMYSETEKKEFEAYLEKQIAKIDLPNRDENFLRHKIIEMYGNTVKNHLSVSEN